MNNNFKLEDELIDEETFEDILENVLSQIGALISLTGFGHVIDGELTELPATEFDTVH